MAVELADIAIDTGDHVVLFYERESELAQSVGRYVSEAIRADAAAIVIATGTHRRAFEAELKAAAIDPIEARREGRLILLDAATTMAAFMPDGEIDGAAFSEVVGSVVRQAGENGRRVCAYGEMVALLWDAGHVPAAIELEELWNDLGREVQFSLLCAYDQDSVSRPEHEQSLREVCHLHCAVVQPARRGVPVSSQTAAGECSADFSAERDAPRSARHFVTDALVGWGHGGELLEDAKLVVTELATNAVVHAHSPFSVIARAENSRVRVSVRDASPVTPTLCDDDPSALSGRGIRLVAAVSADWGVELTADGKSVWAVLRG
jgi:anti-sigma regulatory factor (Ser/Thr protein kinase)